ncbi:tetratricopeptide repeat protein [Soonwooa sp.]|uniref:ATP-binding protein n=1 Tax=Soonwooa sp. TaxID=1938592 RepID=UPI00289CD63C|nr:tetratricopeptide repeat protein [Soonwooa sp.]
MSERFLLFSFLIFALNSCNKTVADLPKQRPDNHFYKKAWKVFAEGKKDSTFYYLNAAKDLSIREKDSFAAAKSLVNMAIIQEEASDNYGSLETSLAALEFLKDNDTSHHAFLASNYNNLGVVSNNLKDYDNAIKFYKKAILYSNDDDEILMLNNNLANTYFNQKKYDDASNIYQKLLEENKIEDEIYARILMNSARAKYSSDVDFKPRKYFDKALKICEQEKDDWGLDAGYAYLSDYYLEKNKDSAFYFSKLMYNKAKVLKSPQDQMEALQKMIKVGSPSKAKSYFEEFHKIDDSLHIVNIIAKNQFALIRYESEKSKLENEQLKIENLSRKYQIRQQQYVVIAFIIVCLGTLGLFYYRFKKRRLKLKLEAENLVKTNKLVTSKKVHDVVANGLYRVMTEIENKEDIDRNSILYKLEEMYEKSRNISYDEEIIDDKSFDQKLSEMIRSFDNENIQIFIVGNSDEIWTKFNKESQSQIFIVIQELLVNMRKHSRASRVILKFENHNQQILISYKDNGVGMQDCQHKNGLKNTVNRIFVMQGKIIFESSNDDGLKINIEIPHQS